MDYCSSDGDGSASWWPASLSVDVDGDGTLDGALLDVDGDGLFDDALADLEGDGLADHAVIEQLLAAIEGIATVSRQYDDTARRVGDAAHSIRATVEETGQSSALTLQASGRLQALVGQFRVG